MSRGAAWGLGALMLVLAFVAGAAAPPVVANVRAAQRTGTKLVDIYYDLADSDSATLAIIVAVSTNGGAAYTLPATSFSGSGWGGAVAPGLNKQIIWNAGSDLPAKLFANVRFRVTADDAAAPSGMALIPAGSFTMGDLLNDWLSDWGASPEIPAHTVYVSAFYMDRYEVTKALWDEVYSWAVAHGYSFEYGALGKASSHPAHSMTWYDSVKWCNARSEKEGKVPAYYTDAGLSVRYRSGQVAPYVSWGSGYRLPTEAEWEKAARGGASGQRFPWGNTISWGQANYYAYPLWADGYAYDVNATVGDHPTFNEGVYPYTSPVGYFGANGYGLYDMAGNVWEWCWDWYGSYSSVYQSDPRGPTSGSRRVLRGGCWYGHAFDCRAATRGSGTPDFSYYYIGFRSVLPPGQ